MTRAVSAAYVDGARPVHPREFLDDPYFLGEFGKTLFPIWKTDLCEVLDPEKRYEEWALVGAQGTGKTVASFVAQLYKLYRLSKLRNPQEYLSLDAVSRIYFGLFSLNREKAKDALYRQFLDILGQCPYFRDRFPSRVKRGTIVSGPDSREDRDLFEVLFPSHVRVISGSVTGHAVSVNLMSAILDEMNWKRKKTVKQQDDPNSALALYEQVRGRIRGRFLLPDLPVPGLLCVISSKRATTDFMDGLVDRMRREPARCFVSDYKLWEAKPSVARSGKVFHVFVGGSYGKSRILDERELPHFDLGASNIISVPVEFRSDFDAGINAALRDIAGVSTAPRQLLFDGEGQIRACEDLARPSTTKVDECYVGTRTLDGLESFLDFEGLTRFDGLTRKPRHYPGAPRFIHVDLSRVNDPTGIAMGCPSPAEPVTSTTPDGKRVTTLVAGFHLDFALRVNAPEGDEIDYDKIRALIMYLRRVGFRIACVSYDQFQSADSMQLLTKQGFRVAHYSVEKDGPYVAFRRAMTAGRVSLSRSGILVTELSRLIHYTDEGRVDHPDDGTKDVADAVCGAFWSTQQALAEKKTKLRPAVSIPSPQSKNQVEPRTGRDPFDDLIELAPGIHDLGRIP